MQKKTITITAPVDIINAISILLLPLSNQENQSERIYLSTIRETVSICLS